MTTPTSSLDRQLRQALCDHPRQHDYRYDASAKNSLLEILFRSLTNDRADYLDDLFPQGFPSSFKLQDAQGVQENAEYSAAARGHPCGHIFKPGEASYHCSTCTDDTTAVLCSRCFIASDHEGHQYSVNVSAGNSGCCDCGDDEAWKRSVKCAIHTASDDWTTTDEHVSPLPADLQESIRITVSRVLDYFCDIISCSPENLRLPKTVESVTQDEVRSRLSAEHYVSGDEIETNPDYCLIIWNDEKHTVREVQSQVARACHQREAFGLAKAEEANDVGRSVIKHSRDLKELTRMAKIIEEIKVTVTIRSSRDTFREQMCGTIIEWLGDIAGSSIAGDGHILRRVICEEMLQIWRIGSEAWNAKVGREDLDDHGDEDDRDFRRRSRRRYFHPIQFAMQRAIVREILVDDEASDGNETGEVDDDEEDEDEDDNELVDMDDREMSDLILTAAGFDAPHPLNLFEQQAGDADVTDDAEEMDTDGDGEFLDIAERMDMDGPSPPPPALPTQDIGDPGNNVTMGGDASPTDPDRNANYLNIPRTPAVSARTTHHRSTPPNHWKLPPSSQPPQNTTLPVYEDLTKNIRVDSMILFDLRLWKLARTNIRDLFISTLVNIPQFKRILGLRFSGLYTTLAQLYLVADREPDHSIINLSLQLLTTPSITEEVIERGNFLTNLMAILYTFLTTRQVGFPKDLDPGATLGFDAGSVANRRLYHFFSDLRYFLASPFVQAKARSEPQYLFQFLDLAKLSQGICPNVRAVGEHVEYETDAWISASLLTRDINKLCRQFAEAYYVSRDSNPSALRATWDAISHAAGIAIINSVGLERRRFEQAEIKEPVRFHTVAPYGYKVVDFVVEKGALSFHHPLHYTLSWLLECGKDFKQSITTLRDTAQTFLSHLHDTPLGPRDSTIKNALNSVDDALLAMFDFPLRVCSWLAQMKANLWVRNGMSLRHQMVQYKSVAHRDVGHHRDLFLLQTALVACDPSRVLASMIDRFGLSAWMRSGFDSLEICDDNQMLDLAEDFVYLLINLLSDRDALISGRDNPESQLLTLRKDIAHTLCFKPLSYSDLYSRLTERAQDHEQLQEVLEQMTRYRPPEGLHDSGLFELKEEYLQELDPYNSHFTKNQRDEAENIYKKWMGKKLHKPPEDIVLEPKLHRIPCEAYTSLCAVVNTTLFADVIHKALIYVAQGHKSKAGVSGTRVEAFLQIVLQLALIATLEDNSTDDAPDGASFVRHAMKLELESHNSLPSTIIAMLSKIWLMEEFSSCRSKIRHMLRLFHQKLPHQFTTATRNLDFPSGRFDTASPANVESEIEAKKKQAMERKARVMAQFQQQQQSFMDKQGMTDWGDEDLESPDEELPKSTETRNWKYPAGLCIQCREDTSDSRFYGTFAMVTDAHILRQTSTYDVDFVGELFAIPENLDRSIESIRPFGVSGSNHEQVKRLTAMGQEVTVDFQGLGKGWPTGCTMKGPVSTSCGHIMHFTCFENYYQSITRRHSQQVARNHPERISLKEFVCPLCKALANSFLPIIWKHSQQSYPGALAVSQDFDSFLYNILPSVDAPTADLDPSFDAHASQNYLQTLATFSNSSLAPAVARWQSGDLTISPTSQAWAERPELAAFAELASIYGRLRETLTIVAATSQTAAPREDSNLNHFQLLVNTLANTIASVEIGHRGREAEFGTSLLTSIPQQTLSHLQTVSSTLSAYAATGALTVRGSVEAQYRELCGQLERQLAGTTGTMTPSTESERVLPLLCMDPFQFLVQTTIVLSPIRHLELRHVLQMALTIELLRVVVAFLYNPTALLKVGEKLTQNQIRHASLQTTETEQLRSVENIALWVGNQIQQIDEGHRVEGALQHMSPSMAGMLFKLCKVYGLAFLRKSAIFFHVAHGVDFPTTAGSEAGLSELERLCHLLHLPNVGEILTSFSEYSACAALKDRAAIWLLDCIRFELKTKAMPQLVRHPLSIQLLHPAPFELIGLPKYFDVLMEEAHKRKCPTTGKEVSDPALCLFCGEIFCSQTVCCQTNDKRGGCNAHVEKCSSPIGMFLFIRKCHVALLHVTKDSKATIADAVRRGHGLSPSSTMSHGSFFPAPYLTKHGETDSGLRSKHQLILNQKRYDKLLRDTWLMINGSVWSTIARKLESEVNAGGWETL
ncbi:E3 ubiquitin-protein ligase UBR1 [Cladophialophora psammophila CBS 110553]|uniref:E3 ubiquitin-protein ligase n=1 Tax=Cladophialophora psammophila CBS 110553 TaxID=1182543 RepID=W9X1Z9_9EURO|nr:E3 ubiquitin-protein ligase UBR1 [Cladophialophora psammophila CBS 110553]EXJ70941.1 E3 ubiquitin-protein ligase UBR1 [Cladophialophora psammophila CBS 110553]